MANKAGLKKVVEKMSLKNLTPDVDLTETEIEVPDINRPALQLTGYFDHFDSERVQIIGYVEYTFWRTLDEKKKEETYRHCCPMRFRALYSAEICNRSQMLLEKATRRRMCRCS